MGVDHGSIGHRNLGKSRGNSGVDGSHFHVVGHERKIREVADLAVTWAAMAAR